MAIRSNLMYCREIRPGVLTAKPIPYAGDNLLGFGHNLNEKEVLRRFTVNATQVRRKQFVVKSCQSDRPVLSSRIIGVRQIGRGFLF